ncbi:MAG TPA: DinB family protein [Actinomycetota bacterium]|nr:DinB family protein [Actinomycetota bacterium]
MISDVASFVRYFGGIHRRTVRAVSALPASAERWRPSSGDGEAAWGVPEIVRHIAEARLFFASAYAGDGWVWDSWPEPVDAKPTWVPALERSAEQLAGLLEGTQEAWLSRKVEAIGGDGVMLSGWRVLMMMVEHEVHHRAQISTYAGLNGWPVHQTFDRTNEWVLERREEQVRGRRR